VAGGAGRRFVVGLIEELFAAAGVSQSEVQLLEGDSRRIGAAAAHEQRSQRDDR